MFDAMSQFLEGFQEAFEPLEECAADVALLR